MPDNVAGGATAANKIFFSHLSRTEVAEIAADAVLVIPVGATEQHGPDMPLATDYAIVEALVERAVRAGDFSRPVVIAPTLAYGHSEHHLFACAGSLSTTTYLAVLDDLIASAIASGFQRVMFVNGHGGNSDLINVAVAKASYTHDGIFAALSYWKLASAVEGGAFDSYPGHAGQFEASLLMSVRPDILAPGTELGGGEPPAQMTNMVGVGPGTLVVRTGDWAATGGWTQDPAGSAPELGEPYRDAFVAELTTTLANLCEVALPQQR
ncbi:creatininase family protein [Propionibacteriaceae bacterium Y2011]|uniref:creatininase family protein n=1 Tax=Microlunatus sp. Y2014 TaxID=3418488 RepID=UPI003B4E8CED